MTDLQQKVIPLALVTSVTSEKIGVGDVLSAPLIVIETRMPELKKCWMTAATQAEASEWCGFIMKNDDCSLKIHDSSLENHYFCTG